MRRFNPEKELRKIQNGNRNRIILFVISLLVVSVVSYSFALYQVRYSKRIIYTKVAPFSSKDIELAVKVEGEEGSLDYFPPKEDGYEYVNTECENSESDYTTFTWDADKWRLNVSTAGPNKCTVTFKQQKYKVTTEVVGNGRVEPNERDVVRLNNSEIFTVIPDEGYGVDTVTCDNGQQVTTDGNTFTVNSVTSNTKCTINLAGEYTITAKVSANGIVQPDSQKVLASKDSAVFTVTPDSGYGVGTVTCTNNQNASITGNTFKVTKVSNDSECTVNIVKEYTITAKVTGNGKVTPATQKALSTKNSGTFTVAPDSGYEVRSISCTNNQSVTRTTANTFRVTTVTSDSECTITITKIQTLFDYCSSGSTLSSCITKSLAAENLVEDETSNKNIRYIGKDPNNYIWFNCDSYSGTMDETNCEKWRIIGYMKDKSLVKIIRTDKIGNIIWDKGDSNNWPNATLQQGLNNQYLNNSDNGEWITSEEYTATGTYANPNTKDKSYKGITSATKNMIASVTWNIGGNATPDSTALQIYTAERESTTYNSQPSTWPKGYIGLMYPSDYGYATSGGSKLTRQQCLDTVLWFWTTQYSSSAYRECAGNDWLFNNNNQWTLTPVSGSPNLIVSVTSSGNILNNWATSAYLTVRPSLYLKSTVKIKSGPGNGSSEAPYTIGT